MSQSDPDVDVPELPGADLDVLSDPSSGEVRFYNEERTAWVGVEDEDDVYDLRDTL